MSDKAQKGVARKNGIATTHARRKRALPIAVIPGIMGSRLFDPFTGKLVWNPMGPGPRVTAATPKLLNPNHLLLPARHLGRHRWFHRNYYVAEKIQNYYELIPSFYGDLMAGLQQLLPRDIGMDVDVWALGYDFRQSNSRSAAALKPTLDVIADSYTEPMIVVAHSMGGLVARYYARRLGGLEKIQAMFLVGSPTLGAPEAYTILRGQHGDPFSLAGMKRLLAGALGSIGRRFDSVFELLPLRRYGELSDWLLFDPEHTGYPTNHRGPGPLKPKVGQRFSKPTSSRLYTDLFTGVVGNDNRFDKAMKVNKAAAFHSALMDKRGRAYLHHQTYTLYNTSLLTVTGGKLVFHGSETEPDGKVLIESDLAEIFKEANGDGSVPTRSAKPPNNMVSTKKPKRGPRRAKYRKRRVSGAHRDLPSSKSAILQIMADIAKIYNTE